MKKFKNLYTLAVLLLSGAAFTACTNDDFADKAMPQQGKTYTLSVNATKGADTRTLTEADGALTATWNLEDEVAVYLDGEKVGTLKPDKAEANALLKGTVTGVKVDDELDLVFNSESYTSQDGTLEFIDANCNYAKATVTVTEIVGDAVNTSDATFVNQQSITKFTFSEEVSKVVIYNGVDEITVTPASATATLYVAIPATIGEADFSFTATVEGKTYRGEKSATLENGKFYTATISLTALDDYIDLSADETANTYMVTAAGNYKFKATVKGNGGIDPITGNTATSITGIAGVKVLWELKDQGLAIKHDGTSYDIFYSDGYVYFSTPETFTSGDAYVAVYDSEGTILWSWLIWATEKPNETVSNGLTIMDRNLAAIGTGDVECRGLMYEWGRKDPFPSPNDGSYTPNSFVPANKDAFSITHSTTGETVAYTVANPTTYFGWWDPAFWQTEDEFTLDMWWKGEKTIYDPCPPGWKVPSKAEMEVVVASGVNLPGNGFIGDARGDFSAHLYGNPWAQYYWTSTAVDRNHAWGWYGSFSSTHVDNHIAAAYSIRPVKEGLDVTGVKVGMVIGANGKFYADKATAEAANTTAEAMVAYLGTAPAGGTGAATTLHGLAIALEDVSSTSTEDWEGAFNVVNTWKEEHAVFGGTWHLPSADDWKYMFQGCDGDAYKSDLSNRMGFSNGYFRKKLEATGGKDVMSKAYWSSTENGEDKAWYYNFYQAEFFLISKTGGNYVRAVLIF